MTRLQTEFQRLYSLHPPAADAGPGRLIDERGCVRALVLEIQGPADWAPLQAVWRGVQTELDLPAPAIAASGSTGLQLWFSLAEPLEAGAARGFLTAVCQRFLPELSELPGSRLRLFPEKSPDAASGWTHAAAVPAENPATGNWSSFVAPDLAPLFAETPWLDVQPSEDGQASLLAGLASITPARWQAATAQLGANAAAQESVSAPAAPSLRASRLEDDEPRRFLRAVMNDETVPLALRIKAAKALLTKG